MRWVHEGEKGAMENCEAWREGEGEPEKQSLSGNREDRGLVKVFTKVVAKHLYALLSCDPVDHWGALGWVPPEAGCVLLLAPLCLAPDIISATFSFCRGQRLRPAEGK